jgi:hypothetical protein
MHCSLPKFSLALNPALLFWVPLVFESLFGTSETSLRSMSAPLVKIVLLLHALQLLMLPSINVCYIYIYI